MMQEHIGHIQYYLNRCLDVGTYSSSFCHKYFSISSCQPVPPDFHETILVLSFTFTSLTFWTMTLHPPPPDTSRVIKSPHFLLWKKLKGLSSDECFFFPISVFWICLEVCMIEVKVSFLVDSPTLGIFKIHWTGCWTTLTGPWFFQEKLDHRIYSGLSQPGILWLYDIGAKCKSGIKSHFLLAEFNDSISPFSHKDRRAHSLLFAHCIFHVFYQ